MLNAGVSEDLVFQALGDPTRRAMVTKISQGPIRVSVLAAPFEISLVAVVQHLQILDKCGLVRTERVGRVRTRSIAPAGLTSVEKWIADCRLPFDVGAAPRSA